MDAFPLNSAAGAGRLGVLGGEPVIVDDVGRE